MTRRPQLWAVCSGFHCKPRSNTSAFICITFPCLLSVIATCSHLPSDCLTSLLWQFCEEARFSSPLHRWSEGEAKWLFQGHSVEWIQNPVLFWFQGRGFPLPLPAAGQQLIKPLLEIVRNQSQKKKKKHILNWPRGIWKTTHVKSLALLLIWMLVPCPPFLQSLYVFILLLRSKAVDWFTGSSIHSLSVMTELSWSPNAQYIRMCLWSGKRTFEDRMKVKWDQMRVGGGWG